MKRWGKRLLSLFLALVVSLALLPTPAYAAISNLLGNGTARNAALLQALREQYGEDAETYLALLESYGLLDENGNLITNETITVDGVEYTLDELEEYLADPSVDLSKVAEVDGVYVTLEELKLILEIERYLAYIQATYFTQQELTDEQRASFYDLAGAWARGEVGFAGTASGINVLTADATGIGPSGVNHSAVVAVSLDESSGLSDSNRENAEYTLTATVSNDTGRTQPISMKLRVLPGVAELDAGSMTVNGAAADADANGEYLVTIPADKTSVTVTFTVSLAEGAMVWQASAYYKGVADFLVQIYDLKNAQFSGGGSRWQQWVYEADFTGDYAYQATYTATIPESSGHTVNRGFHKSDVQTPSLLAEFDPVFSEYTLDTFDGGDPPMPNDPSETLSNDDYTQLTSVQVPADMGLDNGLSWDDLGYGYTIEFAPRALTVSWPTWVMYNPTNSVSGSSVWVMYEDSVNFTHYDDIDIALAASVDTDDVKGTDVSLWTESSLGIYDFRNYGSATRSLPDSRSTLAASTQKQTGEDLDINLYSSVGYFSLNYNGEFTNTDSYKNYTAYMYFTPATSKTEVTVTAQGNTTNATATVSAPAGTYYPGQYIPITVKFSYPVDGKSVMLTVNNRNVFPVYTTDPNYANQVTFMYEVPETGLEVLRIDEISGVTSSSGGNYDGNIKGANGRDLTVTIDYEASGVTADSTGAYYFDDVKLSIDPEKAFDFASATLTPGTNESGEPQLTITVLVNRTQDAYIEWVLNAMNNTDAMDNVLKAVIQKPDNSTVAVTSFQAVEETDSSTGSSIITAVQADVPLDYNLNTEAFTGLVEFYLVEGSEERLLLGTMKSYTLEAAVPVESGDMAPALSVTRDGFTIRYTPDSATSAAPAALYAQSRPALSLDFTLAEQGEGETAYTWGDTSKVGYYDQGGVLRSAGGTEAAAGDLHFAWKSSNPSVASVMVGVDGAASVTLTGTGGSAELYLVSFNGGEDGADGTVNGLQDAESAHIFLQVEVGQDPLLTIPTGQTISIREGSSAVVSWSSNLCSKNAGTLDEDGNPTGKDFVPTTFHVSVYLGKLEKSELESASPYQTYDLTTTLENPTISYVTLDWSDLLEGLYKGTAKDLPEAYKNGVRSLTVTVSAEYEGKTYGTYSYTEGEKTVWVHDATAYVSMVSQPASVVLDEPEGGLYQTDNGTGKTIQLSWTVNNLDTTTEGGGQFELYIASDALTTPISVTTVGAGQASRDGNQYSYTLTVPEVALNRNDPTSYRDAYTITVKAKNSQETNWSSSSYVLYVYSQDALDILVDGLSKNSVTMSNREEIAALWNEGGSDAIVELQRDIALKNVISINYGDYAWAELADQIQWESSNSSVASVNYKQGGLYENIENFSYTSYRPATDFVLSGLSDGSTTITATHARTGINDSLEVMVQTLQDQLYLFQCYPIGTVTTLTYEEYTDGTHSSTVRKTVQSNVQGEAAVYAPYGIAGDVYCQSETVDPDDADNTITWMGTIYHSDLVSSEADSTKLQLYPVNTLQLRRAAQVDLYLKDEEGKPYTGQIIFRGGVYRQGEYCIGEGSESASGVRFTLQGSTLVTLQPGYQDQTVTVGSDGHLRVTMDISQFKTATLTTDILAGERVYYLFQLEVPESDGKYPYYPTLLRVDATLNTKDVLATGDSIVTLEANQNMGQARAPYISSQTLQYNSSATASQVSVRKSTGYVGPSTTFPDAWLTTTVTWWGDAEADSNTNENVITLRDTTGKNLPGQTSEKITYPFIDYAFTENVLTMNEDNMETWGVACYQNRGINLWLSRDGTNVNMVLYLPFRIVNMIGAQQAEESNILGDTMSELKAVGNVDAKDYSTTGGLRGGDKLIQAGLSLVAGDAEYSTEQDTFAVRLVATSDPTVFRAFFCLNMGNMGSGGNVTGIYPDYSSTETMTFAEAGGGSDFDKAPNAMNVYRMSNGTYMDKTAEEALKAYNRQGVHSFNFDMGGYLEADIYYDAEKGGWACKPINGGFHAGGGLNYSWYVNTLVGPVPVNISLTLGGSLEVALDVQRGTYYTISDSAAVSAAELHNIVDTAGNDPFQGAEAYFNTVLETVPYTTETAMDYLVSLRIYLYMRVFAGLGFDFSVLAFKIGVFGQLGADLNFRWLKRNYLGDDNYYNFSAVGPVSTRTNDAMNGQSPVFSGSTGIEFVFKFLFISYEKVFCSAGISLASKYGDWDTIDEIWAANKTINDQPITRMLMPNGQAMYAIDLGAQLESRDYVELEDQYWVPPVNTLALDDESPLPKVLQTGAYSYANPVLSDDGQILLYLSDHGTGAYADQTDITNTRVAASVQGYNGFPEGTRLEGDNTVPDGYGDSALRVAGDKDFAAAVWVRQMENITPDNLPSGASGTLTDGQQLLQFNYTEIVAGIYDGTKWTLHQLTDNSTPDLAPVVATNGTRTIVAWREVNSTSVDSITDFDQQDAIRYAIYEVDDDGNGKWQTDADGAIDVQTLYTGDGSASVKGIEAAMLDDGTAAVVYILDTGADPSGNTDWETVAAIIPNEAGTQSQANVDGDPVRSEDTVRTFQLTTDENLDENPQVAAVSFDDGTQRFVIAWHTERAVTADGNGTESDIRLAALDKNGALYNAMPESLGRSVEGTDDIVGANFRFAKGADNIEELAILWVDSVSADSVDSNSYTNTPLEDAVTAAYQSYMGYDVLKAVKFVDLGNSFTVSGAVEVAVMQTEESSVTKNWTVDAFDAYVTGNEVKSVILGTNYDQSAKKEVEISSGDDLNSTTSTATIEVPVPVSRMFTATELFQNQIDLSAAALAYDELYPNSKIDVQFTIRNSGMEKLTGLKIYAGDDEKSCTESNKVYSGDFTESPVAPNRDVTLTAQFPTGDEIENTDYTIIATFESNKTASYSGRLYLDIPDVGISKVEVVKEEDGQRVLNYALYNILSAKLADEDDGWRVKVGFYADQSCTQPLPITGSDYLQTETIDDSTTQTLIVIDQAADLRLIDAGGFSDQVTFDVASYVGNDQEIPEVGIPVYVKAWVEQDVSKFEAQSQPQTRAQTRTLAANAVPVYSTVTEYFEGNNVTSLILDNLAVRRDETVTIEYELDNTGDVSVVTVNLLYNKITGTETGNLIVTLLDANGQPIEKLQSYNYDNGNLISLSKEGIAQRTFRFSQKGASVQVSFSELILGEGNAELDHVSLSGAQVTYDAATNTFIATGAGLTSGILDIAPKDPQTAKITFNGQDYDVNKVKTISLPYGTTEWTITVTNGGTVNEYTLRLVNTDLTPPSGNSGGSSSSTYRNVTVQDTEHGSVTVSPTRAKQGTTVTITAEPDEGYQVGSVTVTTGSGREIAVVRTSANTYTFTMPDSSVYVDVQFVEEGTAWVNPFTDVEPGAWYYDAVRYVYENGLMNGTSATTFEPTTFTSRAMIATILWRLEGSPVVNALMPFDDVAEGLWYSEAIRWAASQGIVDGYGNGAFGPNDSVTREQLAAILFRYAQYKGLDVSSPADALDKFTDSDQISSWALSAMNWAVAQGIINGTSATTLTPKGTATRAEVAAMLQRFQEYCLSDLSVNR